MKKGIALLLLGAALAGCTLSSSSRPVGTEPPSQPVSVPSVKEPAPAPVSPAPASQVPAAPAAAAPAEPKVLTTKQVGFHSGKGYETATLTVTENDFTLALDGGRKLTLQHKFGNDLEVSLKVVPLPALAPPPFQDHALVTMANGRNVQGWVLVPEGESFRVALEAWTDWGVSVEGHLIKVSNRRYPESGSMYIASDLLRYDATTGQYRPTDPLPKGLSLEEYSVKACAKLPVAGHPEAAFWVIRKQGPRGPEGSDGVYVALGDRSVIMRSPDVKQAPGLVGPDPITTLVAQDLDRDGTLEYILYGLAGAHTWGVWIYHYDQNPGEFQYLAYLAGDRGVTWFTDNDSKMQFRQDNRDYTSNDAHAIVIQYYIWQKDRFVPIIAKP